MERKKLIEEDSRFVSFPPPDYSKMTNEQIKQRTEMFKITFKMAFSKNDVDESNDDI